MKRPWFIQGIHHLLELATEKITCILCSEKDPNHCHRQHLIAGYLLEHHPEVQIRHILADGSEIGAKSLLNTPGVTPTGQPPR
jgi:uncharacterized protein (DUF488 family)